jgi:hypothetical protein
MSKRAGDVTWPDANTSPATHTKHNTQSEQECPAFDPEVAGGHESSNV